jgi:hypothetical protein
MAASDAVRANYVHWATVQISELLGRDLTWPTVEGLRDVIHAMLASAGAREGTWGPRGDYARRPAGDPPATGPELA